MTLSIAEWLGGLGLEQYAPRFLEEGLDVDVLHTLTDQDLKDLGVARMGDRRRLLLAIKEPAAALATSAEQHQSTVQPAPTAKARAVQASASREVAAERRQLTVMFCDLVGSTALTATLDPEDMREVVRAYQGACAQVIARYEGFVAQYLGDGIMAYFGYPTAHEDDAERAVRAGLDLIAAVAKLDVAAKVEVRLGIATGLVVVGDLIGEHAAKERAVTGETPNLAARLQGLAAPGSIVVSAATKRLLGSVFELRDLGPQQLKGLGGPVSAFAVGSVRTFESRFEARAGGLTGFVGREEEGRHLLERKKLAWQGRGQVVLVSGEAGIGKSRLMARLSDQVSGEAHLRMRYQCTPHHRDSALYPTIVQIERAADLRVDDGAEQKLAKLEAVLAQAALDAGTTVPFFAALLAIPTGERYPALTMPPAQQRKETMAAMLDQIQGLAKAKPLLMLYEDAHWADATSLELLDMLVDRIVRLPVFLIVTTRPEFSPAWAGRHNVSTLALQRLDRGNVRALIENVAGADIPTEVLDQIVAKTDGVPLFVEELTKTVIESGLVIEEGGVYRTAKPARAFAIPSTLQDSLMARLDRLNPVKEIAQIGAAIGREFSFKLLMAVAATNEAALKDALGKLEEAELVSHRGVIPDATYIFKHALVQDAAYESLLKSRRQVIHRRIAKALRDQFALIAETEPETVAYHFTAAGKTEQAANWWTKAGMLVAGRGGFVEAIGHFERAIALADTLAPDAEQMQARLKLQVAYREALIMLYGWGDQRTADAFRRSSELAAKIDDPKQRLAGMFGNWIVPLVSGEGNKCLPLAYDYLRQAHELGSSAEVLTGYRILGESLWCTGDFIGAIDATGRSLAIYDHEQHSFLIKEFGSDAKAMTASWRASSLWPVGRLEEARTVADGAIAHARWTKDAPSLAFALGLVCGLDAARADLVRLHSVASELLNLSQKNDMIYFMVYAQMWLAASRPEGCAVADSITELKQHLNTLTSMEKLWHPVRMGLLADLEMLNEPANALPILEDMLGTTAQSGLCYFDAELHRRRGLCLRRIAPTDFDAAAQTFEKARSVARTQKARTYELRASLDLAHLYCDTGREQEVKPLLEGALIGFEPTPELPAIGEARHLLGSIP